MSYNLLVYRLIGAQKFGPSMMFGTPLLMHMLFKLLF